MTRTLVFITAMVLAPAAWAQDTVIIPAVPVAVSPLLQWMLSVAGAMIAIFVPIIALWLRQYLTIQNTQARFAMIDHSIGHAAHLADLDMTLQSLSIPQMAQSEAMQRALNYVTAAHADAIAALPAVDDEHLIKAITARLHQIQLAKSYNTPPSVVISPVSAVR